MQQNLGVFQKARNLIFFEGFLFILLGCLAIASPVISSLAIDFLVGALLIIGGIEQLYRVYKTWAVPGAFASFIIALIALATGAILIGKPLIGLLALTTIVALYFFLQGLSRLFLACSFLGEGQRFWLIVNALLSLVLGLILVLGLPATATWAVGLLVGIDMLFFGMLAVGFASSLAKR
jgi:uncharacterized membrane protein HdeD (DUF308 family)